MLRENERIDMVPATSFKIIQNKDRFSYGTDAIFLSSFAKAKGITIDLGTGTGIIPLRLYANNKVDKIYGVEIQQEVAHMAKRSIVLNNLEDKIEILNIDLKDLKEHFGKCTVDVITTNPPYMKTGSAIVNEEENFAISRHEVACNLEDIISISSYLLKPLGKFYMVHRPNRLVDIIYLLRKHRIEPKYIKFVQPKEGKTPNLLLIEAVKDGKSEFKFYDPLIVYKEDGTYTDEIYEIYGDLNKK